MIISVDPGMSTSGSGITVYNEKTKTVVFSKYLPPSKGKAQDTLFVRLKEIVRTVEDQLRSHPGAIVVVEETFYQGLANRLHQRMIGVLMYHFDIQTLAPTSIKKYVTGSGRADKKEVADACRALVDEDCKIDWENVDITDSIGIAVAYDRKINGQVEFKDE